MRKPGSAVFRLITCLPAIVVASAPGTAFAHVGVADTHGATNGFLHPLSGVDHLLAMIAVGIFAANVGGRAIWLVPFAFVGAMSLGGAFGMAHVPVPGVEAGIGLSVISLGLVVALLAKPPIPVAMALVAFFAFFHGHAHGAEMPEDASGLAYAAGFIVATTLLHGIGIMIAVAALGRKGRAWVCRIAGGAISVAGVAVLSGAL